MHTTNNDDTPPGGRRFLSVPEAADRYGIHPNTLRRAVQDKRIPSLRVGRQIRLDMAALDALFSVSAAPGADPQAALTVTRPARKRRPTTTPDAAA